MEDKRLRRALEAIAARTLVCEHCGVEYVEGYTGPCQEPVGRWDSVNARWTAMCPGVVSPEGMARRVLESSK